jgi:predicted nuclease of predicted toxin-antitoxin system
MKFLIDENLSSPRLSSRPRLQGHDPVLARDAGLISVTDARVLIYSIAHGLPVLTQDSEDFEDLHDLVMAATGHHAGILIVRFDNDPGHNLTDRGIATAISKLESSALRPRVGHCRRSPLPDVSRTRHHDAPAPHVANRWKRPFATVSGRRENCGVYTDVILFESTLKR